MKYPEPQHMLGLRVMGKKGLDAYVKRTMYKGFATFLRLTEVDRRLSGILTFR